MSPQKQNKKTKQPTKQGTWPTIRDHIMVHDPDVWDFFFFC